MVEAIEAYERRAGAQWRGEVGWLGPSGVSAITGARWSAGAVWAEDGNPQATDSDWEDPDDWPRWENTIFIGPARIPFAVYIEGVDFTSYASSASWSFATRP